jgi:hypothetical protein
MVIDEVAQFPRARFDDLTDTVSAGVKTLRDLGVLQRPAEVEDDRWELDQVQPRVMTVREEYGV